MKKKVLYGVALALCAGVSMGTLQSCKDDLSDLDQKVVYNQNDMLKKLNDLKTALEAQIAACGSTCDAKILALKNDIEGQLAVINADLAKKADKTYVDAEVAKLQGQIDQLTQNGASQADIAALEQKINNLLAGKADQTEIDRLDQLIAQLQGQVADKTVLEGLQDDLKDLQDDLTKYKDEATSYADAIKSDLEDKIKALATELATTSSKLNADIVAIDARITNLSAEYNSKFEAVDTEISNIKNSYLDLSNKYADLAAELVALKTNYETQQSVIEALNKSVEDLWGDVFGPAGLSDQLSMVRTELKNDIDELSLKYTEIAASNQELWESIYAEGGLSDQMSQYYNANKEAIDELAADQKDLWEKIFAPGGLSDQMSQYYNANKEAIEANAQAIADNKDAILENKTAIEEIKASTQELWESIFGENGLTTTISQMFMANQEDINELRAVDEELWLAMYGEDGLQVQMTQFYNANRYAIQELSNDLDGVKASVDVLTCRMNNLITGILVQATDSPVFGNFSLPIGVQSNVLFNWCGFNGSGRNINFPTNGVAFNYRPMADDVETYMDENDFDRLNAPYKTIGQGFFGDVNIGKLFLTVNPAGNWFDKNGFALETSAGNKYEVEFRNVKKSNKELYFGYSRAAEQVEGNGFYEADIVIPKDQIHAAKLEVEDGLKQTAKDLLKDPSKRTALNMVKAVYSQLNGMFPAYGVRYNWNVNGQDYSVVSNYNLAAATAKPLSYSFLWDKTISKRLPHRGHIDNIINEFKGKFKIEFEPISFENVTISLPPMDLSGITVNVDKLEPIVVTVEGAVVNIDGTEYPVDPFPVTVDVDDINDLVDSLATQISTQVNNMMQEITDWTGNANSQISDQLKDQLQPIADKINNMVGSINDQIDGFIDDIAGKAQPYFDKLNKLIDLYNKVADKINNVLAEPNHYLQVAMFYNGGNGNIGVLSNKFSSPTPFKAAGGDAIGLYASSYTGEILAPAYMKYVAVSNIYKKNDTTNKWEKVTTESDLAAINGSGKFLNQVMDGNTIRFGIKASSLKKDYIYEIFYQGVDYYGKTSTQKFYITVK